MASDVASKAFLGHGWKFPVSINDFNQIEMSEYEQNIKESIMIILKTRKNERVMRPNFGCGIHDYVFENISSLTVGRMKISISESLNKYEPRIELIDVNVSIDKIKDSQLVISINYRVIKTNNRFNLVFPFYLSEGGI